MLIRGDRLAPNQRKLVLASFGYRWTVENPMRRQAYGFCPTCKTWGGIPEPTLKDESRMGCRQVHPVVSLQTDEQWLKEHSFNFSKDGSRLVGEHAEPASMAGEDPDA